MKILIKGNERQINSTYDKIFNICDKYSTFFKVESEDEYESKDGYVILIKNVPPEAENEICNIKNVEII